MIESVHEFRKTKYKSAYSESLIINEIQIDQVKLIQDYALISNHKFYELNENTINILLN